MSEQEQEQEAIVRLMAACENDPFGQHEIIRRKDAMALGLKRYFTNKPCKQGHVALRWTRDGGCNTCKLQDALAWKKRNRDRVVHYAKNNYRENKNTRSVYRKNKYQENKVIELAGCRKWREMNLERALRISQDYKKKYPERVKENHEAWCKNHPIEVRTYKRNRKKRVRENGGFHTAKEIADMLISQKHECANSKCKKSIRDGYHVDHIMPLVLKGRNDRENLQLLCPRCNQTKGGLHPEVWKRTVGSA